MINTVSGALNAYQQALSRIGNDSSAPETTPASPVKSGFQSMVEDAVRSAESLSRQAEETTMSGLVGKADIQDVVLAVSNAEMALETVVAVRDTAIKAYKEIMQMTI